MPQHLECTSADLNLHAHPRAQHPVRDRFVRGGEDRELYQREAHLTIL